MNKYLLLLPVVLACRAGAEAGRCTGPAEAIEADARCMDKGGVSIGVEEDQGSTYSCLESRDVQNRCGPDGNITRLRAYQSWLKQVKQFEAKCTASGGTFAYEDPDFQEPQNESFCQQAVPELTSNMFEETLCNFHSHCPPVKVLCERAC